MAGKTNYTATLFAQKKLLGKANTSVAKSDSQETIGSNIQVGAQTIFGEDIPENPSRTLYLLQSASAGASATVEYVQFDLTSISGTTYDANDYDSDVSAQSAGVHAYKLSLSSSYTTDSSNTNKGNGVFDNNKTLYETLGACQIVPPNFSGQAPNPYILKLYKETPSEANEIPLLDEIDWSIDYYNGILFVQDYDASKIPKYAKGFIYVGAMLSASLGGGGGGASGDITSVVAGSGLTGGATSGAATVNVGAGTGITVNANDVAIDNSVVATLSGSTFTGNVHLSGNLSSFTATGSANFNAGLSGSLTKLIDGSSYMVAGNGVTISSASNGAITISNTTSDLSGLQFVTFGAEGLLSNERVLTAGEGITISTANPGTIVINNTGLVSRTKMFFDVTGSHAENNEFFVHGINFSTANWDPNRIDVLLNGQHLRSGSGYDYVVAQSGSINFKFGLEQEDVIQVITF